MSFYFLNVATGKLKTESMVWCACVAGIVFHRLVLESGMVLPIYSVIIGFPHPVHPAFPALRTIKCKWPFGDWADP